MNADADGQGRAVEREQAGFGLDANTDGGSDNKRLVDSADAGDTGQSLHNHAETDGNAVEGELSPGAERIGRERALAPGFVCNVVIRLLGGGAREIGGRGLGVVGHVHMEDPVAPLRSYRCAFGPAWVFYFPRRATVALKPRSAHGNTTAKAIVRVHTNTEIAARIDAARGFISRCAAASAIALSPVSSRREGDEVETK